MNESKFRVRSLFKDALIYGTGRYTSQILGILILPIYTRYFPPKEYGIIEIINTFLFIGGYLIIAGTDFALRAFYYKKEHSSEKGEMIFNTMIYQLTNAVIIASLCIYLSPQIIKLFSLGQDSIVLIKVASLNLVSLTLFISCQEILKLNFKPGRFSLIAVGEVILVYAISIYLIVELKMGLKGYFIGKLIADTIFAIVSLALVLKYITFKIRFYKLKMIAVFGFSILVSQVFLMVASTDRFFLAKYSTLNQIGIYAIAFKICSLVALFTNAFFTAWGPTSMSIQNQQNAKDIYKKVLSYYSTFILGVAFFVGVFAKELLAIIVQPSFLEAYRIAGVLAFGMAIESFASIVNVGLLIKNRPNMIVLGVSMASAVNLILLITLIPPLGIVGAVIAFICAKSARCCAVGWLSNRIYKIEWELKALAKALLLNISLYFLIFLADIHLENLSVVIKIAGCCLYVFLLFKLKIITARLIHSLYENILFYISGLKNRDQIHK